MPCRRRVLQHPAQTDFAASLETPAPSATVAETHMLPLVRATDPLAGLVPVYAVKLVRTGSLLLKESLRIRAPSDAVALLEKHLHGADREHFVSVLLDTKGQVIGVTTISVGDLSSALVHPREVFKPAIISNAASVLLAHNHPSGDPTPSSEDVSVTCRLTEAGALLGIDVLDHVIIGDTGRWVSLRERGLCDFPSSSGAKIGELNRGAGLILSF